jgi:uncharacterized protein
MLKKTTYIICAILLVAALSSAVWKEKTNAVIPTLTLSAQATIYKPADELSISVGVVTSGPDAEKVLAENSEKIQAVLASLKKVGLSEADYKTGHFSIQPTYTPYPQNPSPDWRPAINGYEVKNSIAVKTDKIALAGKIIDTANRAGANSIDNIHFGLKNPHAYKTEAINAAATNAIADAKDLAIATNVTLLRPVSISLDNAEAPLFRSNVFASKGAEVPIEGGDVSFTANVTVVYEISTEN